MRFFKKIFNTNNIYLNKTRLFFKLFLKEILINSKIFRIRVYYKFNLQYGFI
jgi:hypothetical protein